jgi:pimeloyl-ACP methyl ester carboxylesterase
MNIQHHTLERDGYHWHVVTSGSDDAPPALLLHSWSGNWRVWEATMQHLDGQYRFIVPDQLGFGQSDKPSGEYYCIAQQAERARFILHHFGYDRARVMGHSMGGQIALTLAGSYPEVVEQLIVVDPAVTGKIHPFSRPMLVFIDLMRRGIMWPMELILKLGLLLPALGVQIMRVFFPRPAEQQAAAIYWAKQIVADGQAYSGPWAQKAISEWDVTPLLPQINAPTLAIWGTRDYCIAISECDRLAAHILDFRAVRIPGSGHFPMIDDFDRYIQAVEHFLE